MTSPAQKAAVVGGGLLLTCEWLPYPDARFCDCGGDDHSGIRDDQDERIMVPVLFDASPLDTPYRPIWSRVASQNTIQEFESEQGPKWREFPSALGVRGDAAVDLEMWLEEQLIPLPVWRFIPLTGDREVELGKKILLADRLSAQAIRLSR